MVSSEGTDFEKPRQKSAQKQMLATKRKKYYITTLKAGFKWTVQMIGIPGMLLVPSLWTKNQSPRDNDLRGLGSIVMVKN